MSKFIHNIDYLRQYVKGELSSREMFEIERESQEDEMLMDIIQGLEIEEKNQTAPFKFDIANYSHAKNANVTKQIKKSYTWIYVAASVSVLSVFGAYIFMNKQVVDKDQIIVNNKVDEAQINNHNQSYDTITSSIEQPEIDTTINVIAENVSRGKRNSKVVTNVTSRKIDNLLPPSQRGIANSKIENPFKKRYEDDFLIVGNVSPRYKEDILTEQILGSDLKIGKVTNNSKYFNEGKVRSDLQRLNIDPQTNILLNQVLDNQARNNTDIHKNDIKSTYDVVDTTLSSALASKKITGNSSLHSKSSLQDEGANIVISTTTKDNDIKNVNKLASNNIPTIGNAKYHSYIVKELKKLGNKNFYFNLYFEVNSSGQPYNVDFIMSSDKSLNNVVITILENGPKWKKIDDKKVSLIIKD